MFNLIRKFLRPTLREQLENGVREALRRYADRRLTPDLRVYVSADLLPAGVDALLWSRDEGAHLRSFAVQWAQDNGISRAGLRLDVILLDTKRDFAFVKPVGLDAAAGAGPAQPIIARPGKAGAPPASPQAPREPAVSHAANGSTAVFQIVQSPTLSDRLEVRGEAVLGRKPQDDVVGIGDRYTSARHARVRASDGSVAITDLDSKNRTFVNDEPLAPHQEHSLAVGDTVRLGTTVLRLADTGG